jgi:16S rRNA (guanine1207-N2)-methyltransferase
MIRPALETLILALSAEGGPHPAERAIFLGAEPHLGLIRWPRIVGWQPFKPAADRWESAGFSRVESPSGKWPLVMMLPGKSRDEILAQFALGHDLLEPGGQLLVALPNTLGAARFEKELARASGGVVSIQKHKCRAFHATLDKPWNAELLENWRAGGRRRTVAGTGFVVEAGIFSPDRIDPGSQLLAERLPSHLRGRVADLGAGWGYLSKTILEKCQKVDVLDLYEADARALQCAQLNVKRCDSPLDLASPPCALSDGPEIHFHWHDVAAGISGSYDAIVMNPPFHSGQATDIDLGRAFINSAAAALTRGGKLYLVANRQLPYEATLEAAGLAWSNVGESQHYKLLFAELRHRPL